MVNEGEKNGGFWGAGNVLYFDLHRAYVSICSLYYNSYLHTSNMHNFPNVCFTSIKMGLKEPTVMPLNFTYDLILP